MALAAWQATIVDSLGNVQASASVEVRRESTGALAAIYSDRDGGDVLANPFTVGSDGFARFYAAGGAFKITATLGSFSRAWRYVPIGTLAEKDELDSTLVRYDITPAETAASVTPTNTNKPPGNIWRYGPTGDGVADDSTAFAKMLACGASELVVEDGTFSVSGNQVLATSGAHLVTRRALIQVRDETGIGSGFGLLNVSTNGCRIDVVIDHNSLGLSGVVLSGNNNYLKIRSHNMLSSADSAGYESAVLVTGNNNTVWAEGYNLEHGASPSGAVPRLVTCQGNGSGTTIPMLKGRNIQDGLAVGAHTDITVACVDIEDCPDNPFYLLGSCERVKVLGGRLNNVAEWAAIKGSDHEFCNLFVRDWSTSGTIENVTRLALRNCKFQNNGDAEPIIATRATNTASSDITLDNCEGDVLVGLSGIAHFSTGSVDNFKMLGGNYKLTFVDDSAAGAKIVTHATGNQVTYKDVVVQLEDDKTTPLTGSNIINWDIPTLSVDSLWDGVRLINNTAGQERIGAILQANLYVRDDGFVRSDLGPNLKSLDSAVKRIVWSDIAPTLGTWAANDRVFHTNPALGDPAGWVCTTAGTPGTWSVAGQVGYRTSAGVPSVNSKFIGERLLDTTNSVWYTAVATGSGASDWKQDSA